MRLAVELLNWSSDSGQISQPAHLLELIKMQRTNAAVWIIGETNNMESIFAFVFCTAELSWRPPRIQHPIQWQCVDPSIGFAECVTLFWWQRSRSSSIVRWSLECNYSSRVPLLIETSTQELWALVVTTVVLCHLVSLLLLYRLYWFPVIPFLIGRQCSNWDRGTRQWTTLSTDLDVSLLSPC